MLKILKTNKKLIRNAWSTKRLFKINHNIHENDS